jgi:Cytosolic motility protein
VLQYDGDHRSLGYWYNWIAYKDRDNNSDARQPVKCGDSRPILWNDHPQGALLGYLDNNTEIAWFSHNGKAEQVTGPQLNNMLIIVRELKGGGYLLIYYFAVTYLSFYPFIP